MLGRDCAPSGMAIPGSLASCRASDCVHCDIRVTLFADRGRTC
jgi:hypothetical protein